MIKNLIKRLLPKNFLFLYHKILALLASFLYQNPSEKLVIIGVTGTAGKSTVVHLIGKILAEAGYKVGWTSSISFKIGEREIENKAKMTMPGRFFMQKILKEMVQAGCQCAVIETSSEGILQSRHLGINYDIAVFTNLSPEHIESHGGFENYKKTKTKLFAKLKNEKRKIINGKKIPKTIIANLDDKEADYFLSFPADKYYGYSINSNPPAGGPNDKQIPKSKIQTLKAENLTDSSFTISSFAEAAADRHNLLFKLNLPGKFNVYNALAAISVARSLEIPLETAKKALEKINGLPGRMEEVISQPFKVIVDYAHTPIELSCVYKTIQKSKLQNPNFKMICVLGSCGGGRDKWKRPELGKLAAQFCDYIILTNEDPYDENPATIIDEIEAGFSQITNYEKILDRKEAIKKAISIAKPSDVVAITGKGCEPWMCVAGGKKIPWDDRKVVREELPKVLKFSR